MKTDLSGVTVQLGYDVLLHREYPKTDGLYFIGGGNIFTTLEPETVVASYSANGYQ